MKHLNFIPGWRRKKSSRVVFTTLAFLMVIGVLSGASCSPSAVKSDAYFRSEIEKLSGPYGFDYAEFEIEELSVVLNRTLWGQDSPGLEKTLTAQISSVLNEHNIPIFPPMNLCIEEPPHILIVSPKDKIAYFDRMILTQDMSVADMEKLESQIDQLGFSALVDDLGGFAGTYPPIVNDASSMQFIINASVEEWFHQYLAFQPLGLLYLLDSIGLNQDPNIIGMNETLAGIVSQEIGKEVYQKYYASNNQTVAAQNSDPTTKFDFNAEMKKTRERVDIYLARGDIQGAEAYMEAQRQIFVANGYRIRKLNQAYFAFHGIYGYDPASVSPVYTQMLKLRAESPSLMDFINKVSSMSTYGDLENALQN